MLIISRYELEYLEYYYYYYYHHHRKGNYNAVDLLSKSN